MDDFLFSSLRLVLFFSPELFYFIMMKRHEGKMPTKLGGGKDGWMTEGLGTTRNKTRQYIHIWLNQWLYTTALKIQPITYLPITDDPLPLSTLKKYPIAAEKNDTQLVCRLYCPFGRSGSVTGSHGGGAAT
ncbi:hypothetical protein H0G86_002312 [Trichoderma simmonsii]|uniref:Uncharacterized protein n=1 Tax=Trichoderma simmonsii TaxID=1491479 RepID=A0A8G0PA13_9HYPO|nr:hypothetical protein H0G86_002312 [Trichoderma simmonsii]